MKKVKLPPVPTAQSWRDAAEASRKQYPNDERRYRYYMAEAERLEKLKENPQ